MMWKGFTLLGAVAVLAISPVPPTGVATSHLSGPFVGPENCGTCSWCLGGHKAPQSSGGDIGSLHSWCMQSADCAHPACGSGAMNVTDPEPAGEDPLIPAIERALTGSKDALATLIEDPRVEWNQARHALQVEGTCDATVIAHIPVNRNVAAAFGLAHGPTAGD